VGHQQLNGKIGSATTTTTKQPKEDRVEPEAKKLRVQASDPKETTTKESGQDPLDLEHMPPVGSLGPPHVSLHST
jgi:hypothetical protein